ncbi:MAG: insulinase family protein [Verrucomicrobia bacterium]|nr:insulinase family protein [Verrucomicrobiota bacterium]
MLSPSVIICRMLLAALLLAPLASLCASQPAIRETTLPNGLKVITREIHAAPTISVWTYYRVGSRNERPGVTGISHLIEHMMFKGTATLKRGEIDRLTALAGGKNNAFTDTDYTSYYFALPSDAAAPEGKSGLDTVLRIEADRMRNCAMDPQELVHEKQVVLSELDGGANNPLNRLDEAVRAASFAVHPYHWPVIGWKCDVEAITRSDVLGYYRTYYQPNNAILILVGDFDTAKVLERVREHLGAIPRGPEPPKVVSVEPEQQGERRVTVQGEGRAVYFEAMYHIPATSHPDMYALGVLDSLLTVGKSSRLWRALVDTGLAADVSSLFSQQHDPAWETILATCPETADRRKFERALDATIADVQEKLVSPAELAKAKRQTITQTVFAMDGVSDQGALLGAYEIVDHWNYLLTMNQRTERVTAEDVRAVARKYLVASNRTVGWFVPTKVSKDLPVPTKLKSGPIQRRIGGGAMERWGDGVLGKRLLARQRVNASLPLPLASLAPRATRTVLPNGMVLLLQENHANPTAAVAVNVDAGAAFDPPKRPGLAVLTAAMLGRGTATRPAAKFHQELDTLGAELDFNATMDGASVGGRCLSADLPKLLELVHDALCRPAFAPAELSRLRAEQLTALKEDSDNPYILSLQELREALYPEGHSERHYLRGGEAEIKAATRSDLLAFYRRHYRPDTTSLAVVGDFDAAKVAAQLQSLFGSWQAAGPRPKLELPLIPSLRPEATGHPIRLPISDKAEAIVLMGARGVTVTAPDYFAAITANHILGGGELLNSRLLASLREKQGLTYSVSTEFRGSRAERPWTLAMQNDPKDVNTAIRGVRAELERMRTAPPTEDELDQARATLVGGLLLAMETNGGIAGTLCDLELYGLGQDWIARAVEAIWKVTPADVLAAARKYLPAQDKVITVIASPQ